MKEMMKAMEKMSKDGGSKRMNPLDKKAKMDVLKDLSNQAGKAMMIKISADNKEGLKEGLEVAKEKLDSEMEDGMHEGCEEGCDEEHGEDESNYEESDEDYSMNPSDLDAQIEKLLKLKEKMKTSTMKM